MRYVFTLLFVLILSCKTTSGIAQAEDFPSGKYQLTSLNVDTFKSLKDYILNVSFEKNSISGTFDCNTFSIDFERNESKVKFGYGMATKMYCEGKMHNENAFFKGTSSIARYAYKKEQLVFYNDNNEVVMELKFLESE